MAKTKSQTLSWLKSITGELGTTTLRKLDETLPWYNQMPAARRSAVGMLAQAGINSFVEWYRDPASQPWVAADVFGVAPRELLRSISLQQTLQLIRVVVQVVEERVVQEDPSLREAVLLYSREIAFSAADVYAKAAEARGLWDARLEALVVDNILAGEHEEEIASRVAALGWRAQGQVAVIVGSSLREGDEEGLRRSARKLGADLLIGRHSSRLILSVGLLEPSSGGLPAQEVFRALAAALESEFGAGPILVGPPVPNITMAHQSARAAVAGHSVAVQTGKSERVIAADDLLAERALAGDALAKSTLISQIYLPLQGAGVELLETISVYLDLGRSLEATARKLFVHSNTVRYRLRRVSELIGIDATGAQEGFVLQVALVLGRMSDLDTGRRR